MCGLISISNRCTRSQPKTLVTATIHFTVIMPPPRTTSLISALYTYLPYTRDYWGRNFKCHQIGPCIHRVAPFYLCGRKINGVLNLIQISFILVYHNMSASSTLYSFLYINMWREVDIDGIIHIHYTQVGMVLTPNHRTNIHIKCHSSNVEFWCIIRFSPNVGN